jgi:hypothetical protein
MTFMTRPSGGTRVTIVLTISGALSSTYDVFSNRGGTYVAGLTDFVLNVNANVILAGSGASAITAGSLSNGDTLSVIVGTGINVYGAGGNGGQGGGYNGSSWLINNGIQNGGSAIDLLSSPVAVYITNHGTLACGTGGDGGGAGAFTGTSAAAGGGGGGGGLNFASTVATPGSGGHITSGFTTGIDGAAGSGFNGGTGGVNGGTIGGAGGTNNVNGATAGANGGAVGGGSTGVAAGAGGDYGYVVKNLGGGSVTYLLHGTEVGH